MALNMRCQAQKGFRGIFSGILQQQKGYLVYVPITRKIISWYDVVFDENISSTFAYTSRPYSEAMDMRLDVTYTPYAKSPKEQTVNITTSVQFEEGYLLSKIRDNAESGDESDDDSIMSPLIRQEEIDAMDSGNESD